jgi:hypothetical protein
MNIEETFCRLLIQFAICPGKSRIPHDSLESV